MKVQLIVEFDIKLDNSSFDAHAEIANRYMTMLLKACDKRQSKEQQDNDDIAGDSFAGVRVVCHDIMTLKVFDEDKVYA